MTEIDLGRLFTYDEGFVFSGSERCQFSLPWAKDSHAVNSDYDSAKPFFGMDSISRVVLSVTGVEKENTGSI